MNIKPIFYTGQNKKIATDGVIFTNELTKNLTIDWFGGRHFSAQQNLEHPKILCKDSEMYLCLYISSRQEDTWAEFTSFFLGFWGLWLQTFLSVPV